MTIIILVTGIILLIIIALLSKNNTSKNNEYSTHNGEFEYKSEMPISYQEKIEAQYQSRYDTIVDEITGKSKIVSRLALSGDNYRTINASVRSTNFTLKHPKSIVSYYDNLEFLFTFNNPLDIPDTVDASIWCTSKSIIINDEHIPKQQILPPKSSKDWVWKLYTESDVMDSLYFTLSVKSAKSIKEGFRKTYSIDIENPSKIKMFVMNYWIGLLLFIALLVLLLTKEITVKDLIESTKRKILS